MEDYSFMIYGATLLKYSKVLLRETILENSCCEQDTVENLNFE